MKFVLLECICSSLIYLLNLTVYYLTENTFEGEIKKSTGREKFIAAKKDLWKDVPFLCRQAKVNVVLRLTKEFHSFNIAKSSVWRFGLF